MGNRIIKRRRSCYFKLLLNVVFATHQATVDGKGNSNSDVSPKVKLVINDVKVPDNTITENPIPQTGIYNTLFVILVSATIVFVIIRIKRLSELKK